jgi:hypothetical protein
MIGADDLDLHALGGGAEILDRQLRRRDGTGAGDVGIEARHVGQHADLHDAVGVLGKGGTAGEGRQQHSDVAHSVHGASPLIWIVRMDKHR